MNVEEEFAEISGLICEPARAKILWRLLDGRAFTATELAVTADLSATSASNHLSKLVDAGLLKVVKQGRHRYFSFARPEVAYAIEGLASLSRHRPAAQDRSAGSQGIRHCRTCYDHLAGYVAVTMLDAMKHARIIRRDGETFAVTRKGWTWLAELTIFPADLQAHRRPMIRLCLDWSERRPHLAGLLGAKLLERTLERKWFQQVKFSRELVVTRKGDQALGLIRQA